MDRWRVDIGGRREPVAEAGADADKQREEQPRRDLSPLPVAMAAQASLSAKVKSFSSPQNL